MTSQNGTANHIYQVLTFLRFLLLRSGQTWNWRTDGLKATLDVLDARP